MDMQVVRQRAGRAGARLLLRQSLIARRSRRVIRISVLVRWLIRGGVRQGHDVAVRRIEVQCRSQIAHHRSEEHTSELQSHSDLVCRLLLEKKKTSYRLRTVD